MHGKKMRIAALLSAVMVLAAGCGGTTGENETDGAEKEGKETVRIFVPGLSERETVDPVSGIHTKSLTDFQNFLNEKIPDYNIELKTATWNGGWIQTMEALVKAGEIDVGFYTNQEAVPDWYLDLTPYLESDQELNLDNMGEWFIEPAVHYNYYKSFNHPEESGKIFGLPIAMASNIITYDSQIFEEWGVDEPTSDMTFAELVDLSESVTGMNPVTGEKNYGAYLYPNWMEWYSLCYNAVEPFFSDTMNISELDLDRYVESIRTSDELKSFYTDMIRLVDCCNAAVATGSGAEKWLTDYNDIAVNFDCANYTKQYMNYVYAGEEEITERYKPLMIPTGEYGEGFPEFYHFAISQKASDADAAWEVVKALTTDKEIIDFYLVNYVSDKLPVLNDTEGISIMDYELNQERWKYQVDNMFITDDYWHWRSAMQTVDNQILSKQYTADQAVEALYGGVNSWVSNIKKQQSAN